MEINYLDLIFGGLILFGAFKGFRKGVIVELASLLALVLGIYGAIQFSGFVADQLVVYIDWDKRYVDLAAFGLTSVAIILGVSLLGKILTSLAKLVMLNGINRMLGLLFGGMKLAVFSGVILIFLMKANALFGFIPTEIIEQSLLCDSLLGLGEWIFDYVPEGKAQIDGLLEG
ncbi:MAG: CvpA family protein [Flavobacteriaceae bacterium]|nr:CvpA family protein [Flavobacteriaceae bacterium]MBT7458984.1 CvpA family protein [Flavobacteriaceae bacterium]